MAQVGAQLAQLEDTLPAMVIDALRGRGSRAPKRSTLPTTKNSPAARSSVTASP